MCAFYVRMYVCTQGELILCTISNNVDIVLLYYCVWRSGYLLKVYFLIEMFINCGISFFILFSNHLRLFVLLSVDECFENIKCMSSLNFIAHTSHVYPQACEYSTSM
jgi:hypothetical protein